MLESRRKWLNVALLVILIFACALFITTLFLLETPYIGFNAFLTASLYIGYAFMAIIVMNKSPSAFSVGTLVGASLMIIVLSFQGAIYWGLAADTNSGNETACYVASVFHIVILVFQMGVTYVIMQAKEDFIDTYAAYEYIPDMGYGDRRSLSNASSVHYQTTIPTADI